MNKCVIFVLRGHGRLLSPSLSLSVYPLPIELPIVFFCLKPLLLAYFLIAADEVKAIFDEIYSFSNQNVRVSS